MIRTRPEQPDDAAAIDSLIKRAFAHRPNATDTEAAIVRGLRAAGALTVSLVADAAGVIVGHVALSPVSITDGATGWYGLAPLSVEPSLQRHGIGAELVRASLACLVAQGAAGCVVLGNPAYYGRFGFAVDPGLVYPGAPAAHFMARALGATWPAGRVTYHRAFDGDA